MQLLQRPSWTEALRSVGGLDGEGDGEVEEEEEDNLALGVTGAKGGIIMQADC